MYILNNNGDITTPCLTITFYTPGLATVPGDANRGGVWGSTSCVGVINLE